VNIVELFTSSKTWLIAIAVAFALGGALGWHERALRIPALLEAQKVADAKECDKDKQITRKANDELQKDRDSIAQRAADYKRLHPMRCVIPTSSPELLSGGRGYANKNGISSDWLREYAAEAELYRRQLITCIEFLDSERNR